jgi:integrase
MGSIDKLPSGKWKARWRTPDRRQRSRVFARKVDAERHLVSVDHEKLSGTYVDPRDGAVTFEVYAETWRRAQTHRPSTRNKVESTLRNHAYPAFGHRPLNNIRPTELQQWIRSLEDDLAPSSIGGAANYVKSIFKAAVDDRLIASSPAQRLKPPKATKAPVVPLTVNEVLAIADEIQPRYRALVMLMAATGLRPAEAYGLTVDRCVWPERRIRIDRQLVGVGSASEFGPPKTEASVRTIPVPEFVEQLIDRHVSEFGLGDHGLVFTDRQLAPIRRNRLGEVWRHTMKRLDFDCSGPHQLRHHYASLLIQHGESVKVVQARLGHASAAETLDTYAHLWPDSDDQTRAAIEAAYGIVSGS